MIQAWLAKNAVKLGIIGVVIAVIFFGGFHVRGKLDAAKMDKLRTRYEKLENNYSNALLQNERCFDNMSQLKAAIDSQNKEIINLASEAKKQFERQKRMYESALASERSSSAAAIGAINEEKQDLLRRMSVMSASEACHEGFLEIIK